MTAIVSDRFVLVDDQWTDLASGSAVSLRILRWAAATDQYAWADNCAALARLRHPLLNVLLDYGTAGHDHVFEAWTRSPPLRASGAVAERLTRHAARLLQSHAVSLTSPQAAVALRSVAPGPPLEGRPLGITLQPRRTEALVRDVLDDSIPRGVTSIAIHGECGSGLRTLRSTIARTARLIGYVPVSSALLNAPGILDLVAERHIVVLMDEPSDAFHRRRVAQALVRLGAGNTRRHVLIAFARSAASAAHATSIALERLGVTAMHAMIHRDSADGPTFEEVEQNLRSADGTPGALVGLLRGMPVTTWRTSPMVVHESRATYVVVPDAPPLRPTPLRRNPALTGAAERAARLAQRGRHAAAIRLLTRAVRVLAARGHRSDASNAALALGWILRDRGQPRNAVERFQESQRLADGPAEDLRASVAIGVALTDDRRLEEGEAVLRSVQSAARIAPDPAGHRGATLALARSLLWQGRPDDARMVLEALGPDRDSEVLALAARVQLASGRIAAAIELASRAVDRARALRDDRLIARSARVLTAARAAAGDRSGAAAAAEEGLSAAGRAHLPLAALRIRVALVDGLPESDDRDRLRVRLAQALRHPLPVLLRHEVERVCAADRPRELSTVVPSSVQCLRELLEATQSADDDRKALEALMGVTIERLSLATIVIAGADGREIVRGGRPWTGEATIAVQAIAAGQTAWASPPIVACASPVRYGGETIGAVACRWTVGTPVDCAHAAAVCGAAALAAAASLRALADRSVPAGVTDADWQDLLGSSAATTELRRAVANAARAPFPVLVTGESGSGKELVARAIHRLSARRLRRLCTINCAALSDELVEAELFGHTRGAFTGAMAERAGLFEEADGGTLFLDEVGELSGRAQAKLLRALQDGEVRRVGENFSRSVDTRVVSATNRSLEDEVAAGRFRADLRFRLDVIRIAVPPLRERASDIPALVAHFWQDAATRVGSRATLTPETVATLSRYDWPGNVRELQNVVASIAVQAPRRGRITPATLPRDLAREAAATCAASFEAAREEFERRYVRAALARAGGHRARTARALGISRQGLAKMMRRLHIDGGDEPTA